MAALEVALVEPDTVAIHGTRTELAIVVVDIEVAAAVWKQLPYPFDLSAVLAHVRLQVRARVLLPQGTGSLQLFWRAGRRKTRRHGIELAAPPMPPADQFTGGVATAARRIEQRRRCVAIHQ